MRIKRDHANGRASMKKNALNWPMAALVFGWTLLSATGLAKGEELPGRWTNPKQFYNLTCEGRIAWAKKYLGPYLEALRSSAENNRIPVRLLATVVLNEMADYGIEDLLQEEIYHWGSVGISQMNVKRAIDSGLLKDYITEDELEEARNIEWRTPFGRKYRPFKDNPELFVGWKKLNDPVISIEIAAKEVSRILNVLSANPKAPWARWFLKGPLDRSDLYRNVKPGWGSGPNGVPLEGERLSHWEESRRRLGQLDRFREEAMVMAVIAAYNTDTILTDNAEKRGIWINPDKPSLVLTDEYPFMREKKHPYYNALLNAHNALGIWSDCLIIAGWPEESSIPPPLPPPPIKAESRDLVARDILVKPEEIGDGFVLFNDRGTDDNSASVQFKHWDKGVTVNVFLQKKMDEAAHDRAKNDFVIMMRQKMSDQHYVVEKLSLGDYSYIVKTGRANFDAQAYPGEKWHLWVTGSYYSFSGDYDENAPLVKQFVTNAISAMYYRVVELESR